MQGIKVNIFDGGLMPGAVGSVLPSPALGLAHTHPVGGLVSGARKTAVFHKGLKQINGMAIFALPVAAQTLGNPTQKVAAKMGHPHPGQDQKTGVVGDQMKVLCLYRRLPADVAVPGGTVPGGGTKEHTGQRTSLSVADQVLKVLPNAAAVTQIMVPVQERIEEDALAKLGLVSVGTLLYGQGQQRLQGSGHGRLMCSQIQLRQPLVPHPIWGSCAAPWQVNPAPLLQFKQQGAGGHVFDLASPVAPVPGMGQLPA